MIETRRNFLRYVGMAGAGALVAPVLLRPGMAQAADNRPAFADLKLRQTLKVLGATSAIPSRQIILRAPQIAENGAMVPIEVTSNIPGTQAIYVLAGSNPVPLIGSFTFLNGAEPYAKMNIKLASSTPVQVLVKAGGRFYATSQEVKVTIGGCGG